MKLFSVCFVFEFLRGLQKSSKQIFVNNLSVFDFFGFKFLQYTVSNQIIANTANFTLILQILHLLHGYGKKIVKIMHSSVDFDFFEIFSSTS